MLLAKKKVEIAFSIIYLNSYLPGMVENGCMTTYADDGACLATDDMALQNITDLEMVKGDWWVLKGMFL